MNVRKIMKKWPEDNEYDGLQHEADCGCKLSDLMPCDEDCSECAPGYLRKGMELSK